MFVLCWLVSDKKVDQNYWKYKIYAVYYSHLVQLIGFIVYVYQINIKYIEIKVLWGKGLYVTQFIYIHGLFLTYYPDAGKWYLITGIL